MELRLLWSTSPYFIRYLQAIPRAYRDLENLKWFVKILFTHFGLTNLAFSRIFHFCGANKKDNMNSSEERALPSQKAGSIICRSRAELRLLCDRGNLTVVHLPGNHEPRGQEKSKQNILVRLYLNSQIQGDSLRTFTSVLILHVQKSLRLLFFLH